MIEVHRGNGPIILGLPHTGVELVDSLGDKLNDRGRALADTDWNIHQLYSGLLDGVTTVRTPVHRYVIDVNRSGDDASLYPGQNTTGLCPVTDFDGLPIYRDGSEPDTQEIETRREKWHHPYHQALSTELSRVKAAHGCAILYDCHSIRSRIPYLFAGGLPDFNIGTNSSTSCAGAVEETVDEICRSTSGYSTVVNGRFKGGWTTRHYGQPEAGIHAIQMELAQSTYMSEAPPWAYDEAKAARVREVLSRILSGLEKLAYSGDLQ